MTLTLDRPDTYELVDTEPITIPDEVCAVYHGGGPKWAPGPCELEIVAHIIIKCDGTTAAACVTAREWAYTAMLNGITRCMGCGGLVKDCWRVVPV